MTYNGLGQPTRMIARGGNGMVHTTEIQGKKYVCKSLKHTQCPWVEIYIMLHFKHPRINQGFIRFFSDAICVYQEPAQGDIRQMRLKGFPMDLRWFYQMVIGVAILHQHGFIHCDVKSSNMLLFDNGVRLNDFGHCIKYEWDRPRHLGTPSKRAPEIDQGNWGPQVDVWGLGTILYELCTGKELFYSKKDRDAFCQNYPQGLEHTLPLLPKMLHPDPSQRISLQDLCHQLNLPFQPYTWKTSPMHPYHHSLFVPTESVPLDQIATHLWELQKHQKMKPSVRTRRRKLCRKVAEFFVTRKNPMDLQELQEQAYMMYDLVHRMSL